RLHRLCREADRSRCGRDPVHLPDGHDPAMGAAGDDPQYRNLCDPLFPRAAGSEVVAKAGSNRSSALKSSWPGFARPSTSMEALTASVDPRVKPGDDVFVARYLNPISVQIITIGQANSTGNHAAIR